MQQSFYLLCLALLWRPAASSLLLRPRSLQEAVQNAHGQMVVRAGSSPAPRGGRTGWAWVQPQYDRIAVPATFQGEGGGGKASGTTGGGQEMGQCAGCVIWG